DAQRGEHRILTRPDHLDPGVKKAPQPGLLAIDSFGVRSRSTTLPHAPPDPRSGADLVEAVAQQRLELEARMAGERLRVDRQPRLPLAREDVREVQVGVQHDSGPLLEELRREGARPGGEAARHRWVVESVEMWTEEVLEQRD